jgi:hypothetical protein
LLDRLSLYVSIDSLFRLISFCITLNK